MLLEEITMADFKNAIKKTRTVIVPYGTVEEHGRHLPLSTDTMVIVEVVKRVAKKIKVFVAPPVHYGVCTSTSQHPGTIGITPETLRRITIDIVRDAYKKGLRRFILISGHGGGLHISSIKEAGEQLIEELKDVQIAVLSIYDLVYKDITDIADTENDSHAGEMETSLILHLAETLVKGRSKEEYPRLPKPFLTKNKMKYWPGGVWGNPAVASREKGKKLFEIMVSRTVGLVRDIEGFK
ncbi:MAG: creatininase family protein [Thermodesulfobacteriota bacterium]